jgi:hypothetical protein
MPHTKSPRPSPRMRRGHRGRRRLRNRLLLPPLPQRTPFPRTGRPSHLSPSRQGRTVRNIIVTQRPSRSRVPCSSPQRSHGSCSAGGNLEAEYRRAKRGTRMNRPFRAMNGGRTDTQGGGASVRLRLALGFHGPALRAESRRRQRKKELCAFVVGGSGADGAQWSNGHWSLANGHLPSGAVAVVWTR